MQTQSNLQTITQFARAGIYLLLLLITLLIHQFSGNFTSDSVFIPLFGICFAGFVFQISHLVHQGGSGERLISFLIDAFLIQLFIYYSFQMSSLVILFHLINIFITAVSLGTTASLIVALFSAVVFGGSMVLTKDSSSSQLLMTYSLNLFTFLIVGGIAGYLSELLRQTQGELFDLREIQRRVYEVSPVGILVSKVLGAGKLEIVDSNPAIANLFGEGAAAFSHPFFSHLLGHGQRKSFAEDVQIASEKRNLFVQQTQFDLTDQLRFLVTAISDQTEFKKLEWDLKQKEKLAAIGGLAAGIAHEIRNPLASISGSIEMLSQNTQSADDQKLMKIVLREISRLNHLITEFLDYAKPEKIPDSQVDLKSVVIECLGSLRLSKELLSTLSGELKINEELETCFILGEASKIKQALLNFFINGVQAMKDSSIPTLTVRLTREISEESSFAVLQIQDTGQGMSEETQKKIFEPFFTTKPKGTGLGLAMTHKILTAHQAKIQVASQIGQGTVFQLKFPLVNPK